MFVRSLARLSSGASGLLAISSRNVPRTIFAVSSVRPLLVTALSCVWQRRPLCKPGQRRFLSTDAAKPPESPSQQYRDVLQQLLVINRDRKVKFGVENTQELLKVLGPAWQPSQFKTVHVAGTNGDLPFRFAA